MGEVEFTQDDLDIFQVVSTQRVPAIWYYSGLCIIHWPGPSPRQAVRQDQEERAEVQGGAGGGQLPECGAPTRSAGGKNSQKRSKTWNSRFARFWMRELWSLKTTKTSPLKCETAALKISKQCLANMQIAATPSMPRGWTTWQKWGRQSSCSRISLGWNGLTIGQWSHSLLVSTKNLQIWNRASVKVL